MITRYLAALKDGRIDELPIADDLTFENPISGPGSGAESFKAFLSGFLPAIGDARIVESVCEGERVVLLWEIDSVFGNIPILEIFRLRDGIVTATRAFFDPRPVLGGK